MLINEIAHTDLERLTDVQFTYVLFRLLKFESEKHKFTGPKKILVPIKINVADAGEDGRIECENTNGSNWILNKLSIFQVKACEMEGQNFYNEFFISKKNNSEGIKRLIEEALDKGGEYVFFVSKGYNKDAIDRRMQSVVEAINYCNTHFGKKYNVDQVRILEGYQITNWVNEYINVVVAIKEYLGISRPEGAKTIEEWGTYESLSRDDFVTNDWINSQIKIIREELLKPRTVIRVLGHSGVGKSRFVYEALKARAKLFKSNAIFFDASSNPYSLINQVGEIVVSSECIFIVDNCTREIHNKLEQEITRIGSKCSLLTIDFELSELESAQTLNASCKLIYYDNDINKTIVPPIIRSRVGNKLSDYQASRLAELSNFLPEIALKLADLALTPTWDFSYVINEQVLKKLLFGGRFIDNNKFNELFEIAKVFSIFKFIPAPILNVTRNIVNIQLQRAEITFIRQIFDPHITERRYNEACEFYIKNKVLKKRGRFLVVALNPLSLILAKEWWQISTVDEAVSLLQNAPYGLLISLIERFKELDFSENVRNIADEIFGPNGSYAQPEILNSELGSRLFRAMVEVNPKAMLETLLRLYFHKPVDELRMVNVGRRNLVSSLELLCFNKITFNQAAKILYRFAQAENESCSNNSQGIFKQLFRPYMSGTEVDLRERVEILKYAISEPFIEQNVFLIDAMLSAFDIQHRFRLGGAETQGTKLFIDYKPNRLEILEYWEVVINLLKKIGEEHSEFIKLIAEQFYRKSSQILSFNETDLLINFVNWLESKGVKIPTSFYTLLNQLLTSVSLDNTTRLKIKTFLEANRPKNPEEIFIRQVRDTTFSLAKDPAGHDIDQTEVKVREIANQFYDDGVKIVDLLDLMLRGQQRYTEVFVTEYLSKDFQVDKLKNLWNQAVDELQRIEQKDRNWAILNGILKCVKENEKLNHILSLGELDGFEEIFISLVNSNLKSVPELDAVWDLVITKKYNKETISKLRYGNFVFSHSFDPVRFMCDRFKTIGDVGDWSVLDILYRRFVLAGISDAAEWDYLKKTFGGYDYFDLKHKPNFVDINDLVEVSERLVRKFTDSAFIESVTEKLLTFISTPESISYDIYFSELVEYLISTNFDAFWRLASEKLLNFNHFVAHAKNLFGSDYGNTGRSTHGALFTEENNWDKIITWCQANSPAGPAKIALLMPLWDDDLANLHPFAKVMIDTFGDNPDFLGTISLSLDSYGWVGSLAEYYESEKRFFEVLSKHSNPNVSSYAEKQIENLKRAIEREKLENEERYLGL